MWPYFRLPISGATYTHGRGACLGDNIKKMLGVKLDQCMAECSKLKQCKAFFWYTGAALTYCSLKKAVCPSRTFFGEIHHLHFYVKNPGKPGNHWILGELRNGLFVVLNPRHLYQFCLNGDIHKWWCLPPIEKRISPNEQRDFPFTMYLNHPDRPCKNRLQYLCIFSIINLISDFLLQYRTSVVTRIVLDSAGAMIWN